MTTTHTATIATIALTKIHEASIEVDINLFDGTNNRRTLELGDQIDVNIPANVAQQLTHFE